MNQSELNGKAIISEDLLFRPSSFEKEGVGEHQRSVSERRRKSLGVRRQENRRPVSKGAMIKFEGLQLKGQRLEEGEGEFFEKVQGEKQVSSARQGGNVYINNNINLYISKNVEMTGFGQTYVRGQLAQERGEAEMGRRQLFANRRRGSSFVGVVDM